MIPITQEEITKYTAELQEAVAFAAHFFGPSKADKSQLCVFARGEAPWAITLTNDIGHNVGIGNGSETEQAISWDLGMQALKCLLPVEGTQKSQFYGLDPATPGLDDGSWRIPRFTVMEQGACVWTALSWMKHKYGKTGPVNDVVDYAALQLFDQMGSVKQIKELLAKYTYLEKVPEKVWLAEFGKKSAITRMSYWVWRNEVIRAAEREKGTSKLGAYISARQAGAPAAG